MPGTKKIFNAYILICAEAIFCFEGYFETP